MSKVQTLRVFVNQRLSLAAEEIFDLFERTIAEYEEQLCRQNKLLDAVYKPEVRLHRADVQWLPESKDKVPPEQQEWSSSLDQEDPPELPHIKEEDEELWTNQEADTVKFTATQVTSDDNEEETQSSQLHQIKTEEIRVAEHLKTESDGEDCGEPEPGGPEPGGPDHTHEETSHSSESEADISDFEPQSDDWRTTWEPLADLGHQYNEVPASDQECNTGKPSIRSVEYQTSFDHNGQKQREIQKGVKPFSCSVCGKSYRHKNSLRGHLKVHPGEHYSCVECKKTFLCRRKVMAHMKTHTKKKPFSCSVCGSQFTKRSSLTTHLRVHTGEKPFSCSVCGASFSQRFNLITHMRIHTGEKPFNCSVCGKRFSHYASLRRHLSVHPSDTQPVLSLSTETLWQERATSAVKSDLRRRAADPVKREESGGEESG